MVKKKTFRGRGSRTLGAIAVLGAMVLGSVPALAVEAPPQSSEETPTSVSQQMFTPFAVEIEDDESGDSEPFDGEVYDDPDHFDVTTYIDEETGESYELRSGITHWEEKDPTAPMLMASSVPAKDVFKNFTMTQFGAGGLVPNAATLRVDVDIPGNATVGDKWVMKINNPFWFNQASSKPIQLKDKLGDVFAVVQTSQPGTQAGNQGTQTLTLTATEDAYDFVDIEGFFEIHVSTFDSHLNTDVKATPVFKDEGGTTLFTGPSYTIPGKPAIAEDANASTSGLVYDNKPGVAVGVVLKRDSVKVGQTFTTIPADPSKVKPICAVDELQSLSIRGFNTNGWRDQRYEPGIYKQKSCDPATGKVVSEIVKLPPNLGWSGTTYNFINKYTTEKKLTPYEFTVSTSSGIGLGSGKVTPVSGEPLTAGATGKAIVTTKQVKVVSGSKQPVVGDKLTYTITTKMKDPSMDPALGVVTTDVLPKGLKFISATGNGEYNAANRTITWGPITVTTTGVVYTVQTEIESYPEGGKLVNTAVNKGDKVCTEDDHASTCEGTVTTPVSKPDYAFTKTSTLEDTNKNGYLGDEGDTIIYKFTVKNTGDVTIKTAKLNDDLLNIKDKECLAAGSSLEPGASATCVGTYKHVITKADVDKGSVTNHATLCVDPVYGLDCKPGTTTTTTVKPDYAFTKHSKVIVADENRGFDGATTGDKIEYWYTVSNTGNVAINKPITIDDDLLGFEGKACVPNLAKGAKDVKCETTGEYTITAEDIKAAEGKEFGEIINHALAKTPGLPDKPGETTNPAVDPGFEFEKHSEVVLKDDDRGFDGAIAGDTINYWFTVTNTGNVALKNVTIDDDLLGLKGAACVADLPVGAKDTKCETTKEYTITKADQEAGKVDNHALAKIPGLPDEPGDITDPVVNPGFDFTKSVTKIVDSKGKEVKGGKAVKGDTLYFSFTAKNTGNVDINTLFVSDPKLGVSKVQCLKEGEILKVGESVTCVDNAKYKHVVTDEDVKAGKFHNVATGSVPGLPDEPGETTTPVLPDPVPTELPKTGAGGIWMMVGAGSALMLGAGYAAIRIRRNKVAADIPA